MAEYAAKHLNRAFGTICTCRSSARINELDVFQMFIPRRGPVPGESSAFFKCLCGRSGHFIRDSYRPRVPARGAIRGQDLPHSLSVRFHQYRPLKRQVLANSERRLSARSSRSTYALAAPSFGLFAGPLCRVPLEARHTRDREFILRA